MYNLKLAQNSCTESRFMRQRLLLEIPLDGQQSLTRTKNIQPLNVSKKVMQTR